MPRERRGTPAASATLGLLGSFRAAAGQQTIALPAFTLDLALLVSPEPVTAGTPTPVLEVSPRFGVSPQQVVLDGRRSVGAFGRQIVSYEWSFGDGEKATGPVARHT